ncbi:MAG: hypothetical protein GX113_04125 [Actinobacteria bacterium]|jgi:hypothetical protein|nr:hypothetical protein [Actinomycetota bacterium]
MSKGWKLFIGLQAACLVVLAVVVGIHVRSSMEMVHATTITTAATFPEKAASLIEEANQLVEGSPDDQWSAWIRYKKAAQLDPIGACAAIAEKCTAYDESGDTGRAAWLMNLAVQYQPENGLYWLEYADYEYKIGWMGGALYGYMRARELLEQIGDESSSIVRAKHGIGNCLHMVHKGEYMMPFASD